MSQHNNSMSSQTPTHPPVTMAPSGLIGIEVRVADTFWRRFTGLMFTRKPLATQPRALLLTSSNCIHTLFMRYALDIVYLSRQGQVTKLVKELKPWRASIGTWGTRHTLEMTPGSIETLGLQIGQQLHHPALAKLIKK